MKTRTLLIPTIILLMIIPVSQISFGEITTTEFIEIFSNSTYSQSGITFSDAIMNENGIYILSKGLKIGADQYIFIKSTDEGVTWDDPVYLFANNPVPQWSDRADLAINDNGDLLVCWVDLNGSNVPMMQCTKSVDNGNSWTNLTPSVDSSSSNIHNSASIRFASDGENIITNFRHNGDDFYGVRTSDDFGVTWTDTNRLICDFSCDNDRNANELSNFINYPPVVIGDNMYVAFSLIDSVISKEVAYFSRSTDTGITWSLPIVVSTNAGDLYGASIGNQFTDVIELLVDDTGSKIIVSFVGTDTFLTQARSVNGGTSFVETELDDGTNCQLKGWSMQNIGDDIILQCPNGSGGLGITQITSNDFGATYSSFITINGTELIDTTRDNLNNNIDLKKFVWSGDNVVHVNFNHDCSKNGLPQTCDEDLRRANWISYSQDGGQTQVSEIISVNATQESTPNKREAFVLFDNIFGWFLQTSNSSFEFFKVVFALADTTPPVITLVGSTPVNVNQFDSYSELGAECLDDVDGQIDGNVVISGDTVDENTVGSYTIDYDCQDTALNNAITVQRIVNVLDATMPLIISSTEPITIIQNSIFDEFDHVSCFDAVDGDITNSMNTVGIVLTGIRGIYDIQYTCVDSAFNEDFEQVRYIVKKVSSGSAGDNTILSLTTVPRLEDIPPLVQSPQAQVISDEPRFFETLFADLFQNRLGVDGEKVDQGIDTAQQAVQTGQQVVQSIRDSPATGVIQQIFDRIFSFFR